MNRSKSTYLQRNQGGRVSAKARFGYTHIEREQEAER
jgi:hypothetical protein